MTIRWISYLIIILYLVLVISKNNFNVSVDLIFKTFNISFWIVIISSILTGVVITLFNCSRVIRNLKAQLRAGKEQKKNNEK